MVFFRDNWSVDVCVVGYDVALKMAGDGALRMLGEIFEQVGISLIGESVAARFDFTAGVEVAVGKFAANLIEVGKHLAESINGLVEAFDVEFLRLLVGAADGEIRERADLRNNVDDACHRIGKEASLFAVLIPAIFEVCLSERCLELVEGATGSIGRKVLAVQNCFRVGDAREKAAYGEGIAADDRLSRDEEAFDVDAVGLEEGAAQEIGGDAEANVVQVG